MEKTVSGLKIEGGWEEVVETSEEVSETLKELDSKENIKDWEYWKPRDDEEMEEEVKQKTVEMACVDKGPIENSNKSIKKESQEAFSKIKKSILGSNRGINDLKRGFKRLFLTLQSIIRKSFRKFEKTVYKHIISKTNPHYFDGEKVSATLAQKNKLINKNNSEYVLHININDQELCEKVKNGMKS